MHQHNKVMAFLAAATGNSVQELEKDQQQEISLDSTFVSVNMHADALALNMKARWPEKFTMSDSFSCSMTVDATNTIMNK